MVYTFAFSVGCFINGDWEIIECVIDFKPLEEKEHEGLYGGKAFVDGTCKIGSLNKISQIGDFVAPVIIYPHHTASASPLTMCLSIMFLFQLSLASFWLNMGYLHHLTYTFAMCAT